MAKKVSLTPETLLYLFSGVAFLVLIFVVKQKTCQNDSTGDLRSTFWFLNCSAGESNIDSASTN